MYTTLFFLSFDISSVAQSYEDGLSRIGNQYGSSNSISNSSNKEYSRIGAKTMTTSYDNNSTLDLDNYVDEKNYIVGSGDCFKIVFLENTKEPMYCVVDQSLKLVIPGIGFINLNKVPLSAVKDSIERYLGSKLKKTNSVLVSLASVKKSSVYISGPIKSPGRYSVSGSMRLNDLLKIANNDNMPNIRDFDLRSIQQINGDSTATFDFLQYMANGDMSQNPYIYPGDHFHLVPVKMEVYIEGEIKPFSGMIPIKQNESLSQFLSLFSFNNRADTTNILVQRMLPLDKRELFNFSLDNCKDFYLQDNDMIIISKKKDYPKVLVVSVFGEVLKPGSYPVVTNNTLLRDILEQAGGLTHLADEKRIVIIRNNKSLPENTPTISIRPELNTSLTVMSKSKDYLVIKPNDNLVQLEPNDEIYVSKKEKFVFISGSVNIPGAVEYKENQDLKYYINAAGGLTKKADKTNIAVISSYGKAVITKTNGLVEPGDVINVPLSQQNRRLSMVILPIIQTTATVLSTILAIYVSTK